MAKRFKLRFSRVLPSFQSCRSKDPSNLPENPLPAGFHLSPVNPKSVDIDFPVVLPNPPPPPHHRSSFRRHVSSAIVSVGCGCRSKSGLQIISGENNDGYSADSSSEFRWKKEEKWHVVAKINEQKLEIQPGRRKIATNVSVPFPPMAQKKKQRRKKKKPNRPRFRISTSSADSGWFSSEEGVAPEDEFNDDDDDDDDETDTLLSSRSFSTDSSFDLKPIRESPRKKKALKKAKMMNRRSFNKSRPASENYPPSPETDSTARMSVFRRLIPCSVEGKVRESFVVVKRSEDPYEDFKRSMLEMILEKQMFEAKDLEQLLHCFLSLNSIAHHGVIVEAFSEIWEVLFCKTPSEAP